MEFLKCNKCGIEFDKSEFRIYGYSKKNGRPLYDKRCKGCLNKKSRDYLKQNPQKIKEYNDWWQQNKSQDYLEKNREKIKRYNEHYREVNREKLREMDKEYYEKNREKRLEGNNKWREANQEYLKVYFSCRLQWSETPFDIFSNTTFSNTSISVDVLISFLTLISFGLKPDNNFEQICAARILP